MAEISFPVRILVYSILITVAVSQLLARVVRIASPDPKSATPFLSANDRSRWATIRALGDHRTFDLDEIIFDQKGNRVRGWHTIDLVKHRGADGREHYYSSKPTLLTTLLAGEYWLLKQATGATLEEQPAYVARLMLVLTNVLPLAAALVLLAWLVEQFGATDTGKIFAVAAACFATFMTTFAVTLNNHVIAAISLIAALAVGLPIVRDGRRQWWRFVVAGLSLGFLAANELPALSLLVLAGLGLVWVSPRRTLTGFVPAAGIVAVGAFGTNYLAHGNWRTPYAHRSNGPVIATVADELAVRLNVGDLPAELVTKLREAGEKISDRAVVEQRRPGAAWRLWDGDTNREYGLARSPEGGPERGIAIRRWDNWYDYEGSYWLPGRVEGIDRGEPSPLVYAANVLVGHHGVFSLTPIWLLSALGCLMWLKGDGMPASNASGGARIATVCVPYSAERVIALTTIVISLVVIGFYLSRPQLDRNYGGGTCCLRWLIWLTPLWLLTLLPAADWLSQRKWGRALLLVLLAISVFSASYGNSNPWSHPWIFDYWQSLGWTTY